MVFLLVPVLGLLFGFFLSFLVSGSKKEALSMASAIACLLSWYLVARWTAHFDTEEARCPIQEVRVGPMTTVQVAAFWMFPGDTASRYIHLVTLLCP